MIIAIRWQCDLFDSRLFVGTQPCGAVSRVPGRSGYLATVLLPGGLHKQKFEQLADAMRHIERAVDDDVRKRLSTVARAVLAAAAL